MELILDASGYVSSDRLHDRLLIQPSVGDGAFLMASAERLIDSCQKHEIPLGECRSRIVAFEPEPEAAREARGILAARLEEMGVNAEEAGLLADSWVRDGDYLLESAEFIGQADFVVGHPPSSRLEDLENSAYYRASYPTMVGRADIYVAFYEAALRHLKDEGVCGFICSDRWMFNQYGAALRRYVTASFAVDAVIQMHDAEAFETEVNAYPSITILRRGLQDAVVVASLELAAEGIGGSELAHALTEVRSSGTPVLREGVRASRLDSWFAGEESWPLMAPERIALLKRLEREFPTVEVTGATVGIGVTTGADKVFVTKDPNLVEEERLLPIAMAADAKGSRFAWSGHYLVNPWNADGLVDLKKFPRLATFLDAHKDQLTGRHVGKKNPDSWYRTIDRVNDSLTRRSKLYLPDSTERIAPVLDVGLTYPHHNLYFITSNAWDLGVLGGILLSDVAQFFIEAYGIRTRGGALRFQAQYIRKIRVPHPGDVSKKQAAKLRAAFESRDVELANSVVDEMYRLSESEKALLRQ
ncbi:MAG: SAM-dependent methyltransferase [Alphaproteobacteria bacterium]|nr:MAG: SAM-dependent methyltransferase [Alphaproteobacteria bacterium]